MRLKPTADNTPCEMTKSNLKIRLQELEENPVFLLEFVWYLMNNSWDDGFENGKDD